MGSKKNSRCFLALFLLLWIGIPVFAETAELLVRILATTDLHTNLLDYDYYQDKPTKDFGLARTAALIAKAREEVSNCILVNNGDLLQGTPLGDYMAFTKVWKEGDIHPCHKAMNYLRYDADCLGNHEFNYGLDFLRKCVSGAHFPYVCGNIELTKDGGESFFSPYVILQRNFVDTKGQSHLVKIGVVGFVPPKVIKWDRNHLEGKLVTKDIMESAKKWIPIMKKEGADLILALAHSGIQQKPLQGLDENVVFYLPSIAGIDAIVAGHSHDPFPDNEWDKVAGIDIAEGKIHGVPVVMPSHWGKHLGVIDFKLIQKDDKWCVAQSKAFLRPILKTEAPEAVDLNIGKLIAEEHEATLSYVRTEMGATKKNIHSYFALIEDNSCIQLVNDAQKWYIGNNIQDPKYQGLPILSVSAPFKCGGRNGWDYYTDIPAGKLAVKNIADLYVYPNTLNALLLTGAMVQEWLEMSACIFYQIDPEETKTQYLVDPDIRTYNFDIVDGVTYQIDVRVPKRYNDAGVLVNPEAHRIQNLRYKDKPIDPEASFLVVTNNFRADGGGSFPGISSKNVVMDWGEIRQIIIEYIKTKKEIDPTPDGNWSFVPFEHKGEIRFITSSKAKVYADSIPNLKLIHSTVDSFDEYSWRAK